MLPDMHSPAAYTCGIGAPDAVIAVVGNEALASLKETLEARPKAIAPLRMQVSVARLAPALAETDEQRQILRNVFPDGDAGEIRIALEGGGVLRLSLTADLSVIRFASTVYTMRQAVSAPAVEQKSSELSR